MYCPECGLQIKGKYNFCPKCGFNLDKVSLTVVNSFQEPTKAYSVKLIRLTFPMAYQKWSKDEEDRLIGGFHQGLTIAELAEKHERNEGAIRSKLSKLGLIDSR